MDLDESVHLTELTPVILESSDGQQTEVKVAWHSVPVTFQHLSSVTKQISDEDTSTLQNCNVEVESVQLDEDSIPSQIAPSIVDCKACTKVYRRRCSLIGFY